MKKKICTILALTLAVGLSSISNVSAADYNIQDTSEQSKEEMTASKEKEAMAKKVFQATVDLKKNAISKQKYDTLVQEYKKNYSSKNLDSKSSTTVGLAAESDTFYLGLNLVRQETNWYCGPASALMVLARQGISQYNGRSLTQYELAKDLGALSAGAVFPGTWYNTMRNWSGGTPYVTTWAYNSTLSDWKDNILTYTYISSGVGGHGVIYDTVMSGSNQLPGYAIGSERKHYVAGDGYSLTDKTVHYYDPHNLNNSAYGAHWTSAALMGSCTYERGMIW